MASAEATTAPKESTQLKTNRTGGFMEWYERYLEAAPVRTKMATGAILWGTGDAVAQVVPQVAFDPNATVATANDGEKEGTTGGIKYDFVRTGRAVTFGFLFHAPTSHLHFNFLEWMTVRAGVTGLGIPVFKAFMEQVSCWASVTPVKERPF